MKVALLQAGLWVALAACVVLSFVFGTQFLLPWPMFAAALGITCLIGPSPIEGGDGVTLTILLISSLCIASGVL